MKNTWPGDYRMAISQTEHNEWNQNHYPGTRQMCNVCGGETGRTEETTLRNTDELTLCLDCFEKEDEEGNIL